MTEARAVFTVLVVDDQEEVRVPVAELLREVDGLEVVGQAANGAEGVDEAGRLSPDVVLMDLRMPVMDGVEATRRITEGLPGSAVLVHSAYGDESLVLEALQAGARGYVLKGSSASDLVSAVRSVAQGHAHISDEVARSVVQRLVEALGRERQTRLAAEEASERLQDLNRRQREFARQAAHELRSPLTGLMGNLELLSELVGEEEGDEPRVARAALASARRLCRLAADLEVTAAVDAVELSAEPVRLREVVAELTEDLGLVPGTILYEARNGDVVQADRRRLLQVLSNVVRNSLEAAPSQPVSISVDSVDDMMAIEISDRGPGFKESQLRESQPAFSMGPGAAKGLGVGLYVAGELVRRMGGDVLLSNRERGGATVLMTLPRSDR